MIVHNAATAVRQRYVNGEVPNTVEAAAEIAAEVCEAMLVDPQTLARALANLTPEQRQGVLVLYDKLASLGV
jgi:hypothetical protein